ncbi:MAG: DUF1007 family protein [Filomicrobium sp.]
MSLKTAAWPALLTIALMQITFSATGNAHPHVWVDVKTKVDYKDGKIVGFKNSWTFDEGYSTMAIEGLDTNGDGKYDRKELAELAQVNIDGLKEFDYFTHPKLNDARLKIGTPKDYWLERKNEILTLHFTLPLVEPVLAEAEGFTFQVYDPTFYISFEFIKKRPIVLSKGAPAGCRADVKTPNDPTADMEKLGEAFFQQFGGDIGISLAQTVTIACPAT